MTGIAVVPQIFFWSEFLRISLRIEEKYFHFFNKSSLIFFGQLTAGKQGSGLFFYFLCLCNAAGTILLADICVEEVIVQLLLEGGFIHKIIRSDSKSSGNLLDCINARFTLVGFNIADRTIRHRSPTCQFSHTHVLGGAEGFYFIHIENLHIHLDERMTSYNSFQPDDKPEDKEEEELPDIDVDEMLVQIKQSTGLCMKSILAVLEAEHKYLDSIWGTDDDDSDEEDNA